MTEPDRLDAAASVLVVIDVQNDFCDPRGVQGQAGKDMSAVEPAVERMLELIAAARDRDVPVVFVHTTHSAKTDTPEWLARRVGPDARQNCAEGTWGAELYRIAPQPGEAVVVKHRYDGFISTELDEVLRRTGRPSLLFCGTTTHGCVETTLRAAVCRDYLATLVEDCCVAYTAAGHQRALDSVRAGFGLVTDSHAVREHWASQAPSVPARA